MLKLKKIHPAVRMYDRADPAAKPATWAVIDGNGKDYARLYGRGNFMGATEWEVIWTDGRLGKDRVGFWGRKAAMDYVERHR